jgi:hypothetical protein
MVHLKRAVAFRVTNEEYGAICQAAKNNGLVVSRWIREICVAAASHGAHVEKSVRYAAPRKRRRRPERRR